MFSGWEWLVVILIVVIVIFWGPKKLPELARSIGEARREFEKASKELQEAPKQLISLESSSAATGPSSDDILIMTAEKLGINTRGKTKDQISQEIVERVKAGKEASQ